MARLLCHLSIVLVLIGAPCCRSRKKNAPRTRVDATAGPGSLDWADLRQGQARALARLLAGDRPGTRQALGQLRQQLAGLEHQARRACRGQAKVPDLQSPERAHACNALAAITAINDWQADRLEPDGPLAEQVEVQDQLVRRLLLGLGVRLQLSPVGRLKPVSVLSAPVAVSLGRPVKARGHEAALRCTLSPPRPLLSASAGAVLARLSRLGRTPALVWRRDCALARPRCRRDTVLVQAIDPSGPAVNAARDTGLDVTGWDAGEPFVLRGSAARGLLLFSRGGDQFLQRLGPVFKRQGSPVLVLALGDEVRAHRFAATPRPAFLSVAARRQSPMLLHLSPRSLSPRGRARLLPEDPELRDGGTFGEPALWGGPEGWAVALTTVRHLRFYRFDGQGRPLGPAPMIRLGRRLLDPECNRILRVAEHFYVLTFVRRTDGKVSAVLTGYESNGRFGGPAAVLDVPVDLSPRCPVQAFIVGRRLVVVAEVAARRLPASRKERPGRKVAPAAEAVGRAPAPADRSLVKLEYHLDGRRAGLPVPLAQARALVGVVPVERGALVVWEPAASGKADDSPRGRSYFAARLVCR